MTLLLSCLPPTPTLPPLFFSKRSSVPLTSIPHHQPGPLGGLLASVILDKLGRKFVIILINVLSIVAWSIQSWTDKEDAQTMFYQLLVARLIIGQCPTTFFGKWRIMRIIPHRYSSRFIKFTGYSLCCRNSASENSWPIDCVEFGLYLIWSAGNLLPRIPHPGNYQLIQVTDHFINHFSSLRMTGD